MSPIVHHLFMAYLLTGKPNFRQTLVSVLRAGQSPNLHTAQSLQSYMSADTLPAYMSLPSGDILATVLDFDMRADLDLAQALLSAGYQVGSFYVNRSVNVGASYLGVLQRPHDYALGP